MPTTNAMMKRIDKIIDKLVDRVYRENCTNIEIDMMDISKIFKVGREAYLANAREQALRNQVPVDGTELAEAVKVAVVNFVQTIRKN